MTNIPPPDAYRDVHPLPYATPQPASHSERSKTLGGIVMFNAFATIAIFFFAGRSWPAVAATGILAIVVIAYGHFLTRNT